MRRKPLRQGSHTLTEMKLVSSELAQCDTGIGAKQCNMENSFPTFLFCYQHDETGTTLVSKTGSKSACKLYKHLLTFGDHLFFRFKLTTEAQLAYQLWLIKDFQLIWLG